MLVQLPKPIKPPRPTSAIDEFLRKREPLHEAAARDLRALHLEALDPAVVSEPLLLSFYVALEDAHSRSGR